MEWSHLFCYLVKFSTFVENVFGWPSGWTPMGLGGGWILGPLITVLFFYFS